MTRVIDFNANYGQHMAIMAAFERVRGEVIVTLDADLQNPPEEIPKLLALIDAGPRLRRRLPDQPPGQPLPHAGLADHQRRPQPHDHHRDDRPGLHAARLQARRSSTRSCAAAPINTFIPALAYSFAGNPTEVGVRHEERHAGVSNYSFYKLIRLNFDLITGFSLAPLQVFTMFAHGLLGRQLRSSCWSWPTAASSWAREAEGVFTLFGILFFLLSVAMVGIGLIGEYVGRTYQVVRARQRYYVREMLETKEDRARRRHARPRILFFGYSEVGHDCLSLLLERGRQRRRPVHARGQPGREDLVQDPGGRRRGRRGIPIFTPGEGRHARVDRANRRAAART